MTSISQMLNKTKTQLETAGILTARLDAEVLLAHAISKNRTWLAAHGDEELSESEEVRQLESLVTRRLNREPIAYIVGKKEFYGRDFAVTPNVLIPRPETEDLIELTLSTLRAQHSELRTLHLLDVGCGSGCVGITLKLENPTLNVTLSDISTKALQIAQQNAKRLSAKVDFTQSNLLSHLLVFSFSHFDFIVANLPYVDKNWKTSPELKHEPELALYANDNGLELIKKLIEQTPEVISPHGYLLLEADPEQHDLIVQYAEKYGLTLQEIKGYAIALRSQD